MKGVDRVYLSPTAMIDSDSSAVIEHAHQIIRQVEDTKTCRAVALYNAVRDGIWYDPYSPFYRDEHYRASNVLKRGRGYCVGKAVLLCALGRAAGIPSRLGFATVRNHLATRQLIEYLGSDVFVYHGFTEFYLDGKWVKATPAFNKELCHRHRVSPAMPPYLFSVIHLAVVPVHFFAAVEPTSGLVLPMSSAGHRGPIGTLNAPCRSLPFSRWYFY